MSVNVKIKLLIEVQCIYIVSFLGLNFQKIPLGQGWPI